MFWVHDVQVEVSNILLVPGGDKITIFWTLEKYISHHKQIGKMLINRHYPRKWKFYPICIYILNLMILFIMVQSTENCFGYRTFVLCSANTTTISFTLWTRSCKKISGRHQNWKKILSFCLAIRKKKFLQKILTL